MHRSHIEIYIKYYTRFTILCKPFFLSFIFLFFICSNLAFCQRKRITSCFFFNNILSRNLNIIFISLFFVSTFYRKLQNIFATIYIFALQLSVFFYYKQSINLIAFLLLENHYSQHNLHLYYRLYNQDNMQLNQ